MMILVVSPLLALMVPEYITSSEDRLVRLLNLVEATIFAYVHNELVFYKY